MAHYPSTYAGSRKPTVFEDPVRIEVQAWADKATEAMHTVFISSRPARGTSVTLAIPPDEQHTARSTEPKETAPHRDATSSGYTPRRKPLRRDSLERREALLKGKEGSRRRQRWENDRLLSNPWAQPPLPSDWEVHPTYPRHVVPYFLAPLWEADMAARAEAAEEQRRRNKNHGAGDSDATAAGRVAKELREKLKRAKAAKGLLQDLEEEVRKFVAGWERKQQRLAEEGLHDADSDEEEIVFVGRNGQMHDMPPSPTAKRRGAWAEVEEEEDDDDVKREKLVFDSLADEHGASFGRWLVHSIASYYGLRTWSVTVGDPARREAYVGIKQLKTGKQPVTNTLPRPLWGMV